MKRVNTINPLAIADEVRPKGRSDVGKINRTKTTTANQKQKKRTDKKEKLLANPDIKQVPPDLRNMIDELVTTGYRAMARHYHPDKGGDTRAMQLLNAAAEWLRRRTRGGKP